MGDLLKDLARTRPSTPDVDPERMERDLARIVALPRSSVREWTGAPSYRRWLAPLVVGVAVVALAVASVPSGPQVLMGTEAEKWHVLSRSSSLMVLGEPGKGYVVRISSETDRWLTPSEQVTISQLAGDVAPFEQKDVTAWEAAGKPTRAPQIGGDHDVRIGPMRPAVSKTNNNTEFETLRSLPANPTDLLTALDKITGNDGDRTAKMAIGILSANVRPDQRAAAYELVRWHNPRELGTVTLPDGRQGIGLAIRAAPKKLQFTYLETHVVVDPGTFMPLVVRDVLTWPAYGLPVGTTIAEEEFKIIEATDGEPALPSGVTVNGEVESPIIER